MLDKETRLALSLCSFAFIETKRDRMTPGNAPPVRRVTIGPNRLEVRTTRCGRVNPGPIPGSGTFDLEVVWACFAGYVLK